jgi:hypothetical protein
VREQVRCPLHTDDEDKIVAELQEAERSMPIDLAVFSWRPPPDAPDVSHRGGPFPWGSSGERLGGVGL